MKSLGSNLDGLLWFVHVTDIHLSKFRDPDRITEFQTFCVWVQKFVKPPVVVVSGDLTDAKTSDFFGSRQWLQEWQLYQEILRNCFSQVDKPSQWLDIRGNHDTFDVTDDESKNNFFAKYSVQGPLNKRSYLSKMNFHNRSYGFVGVDATLVPGPKRPFNFFGALDQQNYDHVQQLVEQVRKETDHHFVFGHYPTSCILAPSPGLREMLNETEAYLCGHLHTLGGLVPEMFTWQTEGFLELELGDWKDNRIFRIMSLDQGQLSFSDQVFMNAGDETAIVITNPIDIRFSTLASNVQAIRDSTHIRVLVYSEQNIEKVTVTIDSTQELKCEEAVAGEPLYVTAWDPIGFDDGKLHSLQVNVTTSGGRHFKYIQFGLQEKNAFTQTLLGDFKFGVRLLLMGNLMTMTQACFALSMLGFLVVLCIIRLWHNLTMAGHLSRPRRPPVFTLRRLLYNFQRRFWLLAATDSLFYPLMVTPIYLLLGPWAVGYFLEDHFGINFAWGLYVNGTLLHGDTASVHGVFFIAPYLYLFTFGLSFDVDRRYLQKDIPKSFRSYCTSHLWFVIFMCFQALHYIENYFWYGIVASLGVCGLSKIVFFYILWNRANSLSDEHFSELRSIWPINS